MNLFDLQVIRTRQFFYWLLFTTVGKKQAIGKPVVLIFAQIFLYASSTGITQSFTLGCIIIRLMDRFKRPQRSHE